MKRPRGGENLPIRNSTAEFLIFAKEAGADTIAVRFQDEMLWLTLNGLAELFDVDKSVVSRHLSNIYVEGELVRRQLLQNMQRFKPKACDRRREILGIQLDKIEARAKMARDEAGDDVI